MNKKTKTAIAFSTAAAITLGALYGANGHLGNDDHKKSDAKSNVLFADETAEMCFNAMFQQTAIPHNTALCAKENRCAAAFPNKETGTSSLVTLDYFNDDQTFKKITIIKSKKKPPLEITTAGAIHFCDPEVL